MVFRCGGITLTSRFGWIDFAEEDRQQMLDILKLFALRDTRDELGIGTVRDAFANYFFPGTTTIQTRARYFLIVPWIYQEAARRGRTKNWSASRLSGEVDGLERSLIDALKRGGEAGGVVGRRAGRNVERLPGSVYWPGLLTLNIRRFTGSQSDLTRWLSHSLKRGVDAVGLRASEMDAEAEEQPDVLWHGSLPPAPNGMLRECTLALTAAEAEYLRERIRFSHPHSLFAAFLDADSHPLEQDFVWEHPLARQTGGDMERAVEDARRFSLVFHGAAYLYNLMLAERWLDLFGEDTENRVSRYRNALEQWSDATANQWAGLRSWCAAPEQLWSSPALRQWRPVPATRSFVNRWFVLLSRCRSPVDIVDQPEARTLIWDREYFLQQANRARLHNVTLSAGGPGRQEQVAWTSGGVLPAPWSTTSGMV